MSREEIKKAACCFCFANCAVLVHIKDGVVTKVEGNKENALSRGHVCERVAYAAKWLYHPEHLTHPLKRIGQRGEGKWQRITWDQALNEIALKLTDIKAKYGAESLVFAEGTYRGSPFWPRSRFASLFGNPQNITHPGISCMLNCNSMQMALIGGIFMVPALSHTNCLVLWGQNPADTSSRMMGSINRRREKGGFKMIVIDPRRTKVAEMADIWLQLRPGTDGALALAWLNVIINEGLYDKEFVERWTFGFDKLAERVQEYPPERTAEITGLSVNNIIDSARMFATTKPAVLVRGLATDQIGRNSIRVEQARVALRAITGNLDNDGGNLITGVGPEIQGKRFIRESHLELLDKITPAVKERQLGFDKYKLMSWAGYNLTSPNFQRVYGEPESSMHRLGITPALIWKAILTGKPYPVKAMITWGSNPLMWAANTQATYEAFKSPNLELHVVGEYWLTSTAELADYVLPVASWLEKPLCSTFEDFSEVVFGGERSIPPVGERRDEYAIWRDLGTRMGQAEYWPWKTYEEVIESQIKPLGVTYEQLINMGFIKSDSRPFRGYEQRGFPTATGKVELYSTVLEKLGYDPLPFYEEPAESPVSTPELTGEYPLILNTGGHFMPFFHSEYRHLGIGMRERHPDPIADIHPETAAKLNIDQGDWMWIETRRGKIKQRARLNEGILPNVVNVQASWWFPEKSGAEPSLHGLWESNANVLTANNEESLDPLTGGWYARALLCKVYKA
ncbi:MAG: molybdopterin-dependent oxidoreductase [Dehalococcoidales bacterium]|nr:molybdopterin-dependent oxidoreductase [Dehalococcoidales bacterium]